MPSSKCEEGVPFLEGETTYIEKEDAEGLGRGGGGGARDRAVGEGEAATFGRPVGVVRVKGTGGPSGGGGSGRL